MIFSAIRGLAAITGQVALLAWTAAAVAASIDDARLKSASDADPNWLTANHDYANRRFSALDQINRDNVRRLAPAWIHQTGISATFQTTPLVADGVMYITTPMNDVVALDAATGQTRWRYRHSMKVEKLCCGPANRGAGLGYGMVYMATADGRLIALDQDSGKPLWDVFIAAPDTRPTETLDQLAPDDPLRQAQVTGASGLGANMAPLVFDGLVIAGVTGAGYGLHVAPGEKDAPIGAVIGFEGQFGRRGYLAAFDAKTGAERWRWYTTKDSGWEGEWRETTPDGAPLNRDIAAEKARLADHADSWQTGGGSTWTTPAFDSERGLIYLGVGNPAPQMDDVARPGDNLYTVSLVALDAKTGQLRWHYQQVPHDIWGYDVASPPMLFELGVDGQRRAVVGQAGKTGWFYVNDRDSGALLFKSEAFVPQDNMFARATAEGVVVAPGAAGGASWSPASFDPARNLAFVAAVHMPMRYSVRERPKTAEQLARRYSVTEPVEDLPQFGLLSAIDLAQGGKIKWQTKLDQPLIGGVVATAGGLVFMGEGNGWFNAFDSDTGARLWRFYCGAGVNAPPMTYQAGGRQYVAVAAGGSKLFGFAEGDAVIAFALPE